MNTAQPTTLAAGGKIKRRQSQLRPEAAASPTSQVDNALWALGRGFRVFPCLTGSKEPNGLLVPHGVLESTIDEAQVRRWWTRCPNGNAGIHGGVIVDCDTGINSLAEAEAWREKVGLPSTLAVRTGRRTSYGVQFHYTGETKTGPYELSDVSGEVRSGNAYGMAPGSIHPDTGQRYEVVVDLPRAAYPLDCRLEQSKKKAAKKLSQDPAKLESGEKIKPSFRQYWLVGQCGRLRRTGLGGDPLFAALRALRDQYCERPEEKTDAMLRQICESGEKNYGVHAPGTVSVELPYRAPVTEMANAERFLGAHHADTRYLADRGIFATWNGKFWALDDFGGIMRRMAETARGIYFEAANEQDEDRRKALASWAKASESRRVQENSVNLARHDLRVEVRRFSEVFDKQPMLLNISNGTIDLTTGELLPHRREDFITKMVPLEYDADAGCPKYQKFLAGMLPSPGLAGYLTRFMGCCLTGLTSDQAWFLFHGPTASGKSTLLNILRGVLGPYALALPEGYFLATKNSSDFATANLAGVRLATCVETNEGRRLDVAKIKHLTGGDPVSAALKYENYFTFTPEAKLVLATNHAPRVPESDDSIWRRIKVIPFTHTVPESERIPDLAQRLLEEEGPGILRLAVLGCQAWLTDSLSRNEPDSVKAAVQDYRSAEDLVAAFFSECCIEREDARTSRADAYKAFFEWSRTNGIRAMSAKQFAKELQRLGKKKDPKDESRFWTGFRVRQ